jgi:hypothetical protein
MPGGGHGPSMILACETNACPNAVLEASVRETGIASAANTNNNKQIDFAKFIDLSPWKLGLLLLLGERTGRDEFAER